MNSASDSIISPLEPLVPVHAPTVALVPPTFPRIVALGGGTGLPVVLGGLAEVLQATVGESEVARWTDSLAAIVTVTDDGGSSGRLRRELGMLPPGDIRNCLAALSSDVAFKRLLAHRFDAPTAFDGHAVGNMMLVALTQMTGSFAAAIDQMATLLKSRGRVYPSTIEDVTLQAEMATGEVIEGETAIVAHPGQIRRLSLARHVRPWPDALRALINADAIVVGPGSLYTSVLPNLLVDGVASTLSAVRGARIAVMNLMTEPGETDGFSLDDHLRVLQEHTGRDLFDYVLVNRTQPTAAQLAPYRKEGAELIRYEGQSLPSAGSAELLEADLLDTTCDKVRHDSEKLAAVILEIAQSWRHPLYDQAGPAVVS
jgi:uncharacterized cofD-like protein